jgi:hypothetical protein
VHDKLLLYIDILGFSALVDQSSERIDDLYEIIASLNVHEHGAFRSVIFSDTILVYNIDGGDTPRDLSYLLMYECEFAKDLLHRLTNRGIVFRAVITRGPFRHYQLNDVPCFYGSALVKAHDAEKDIKAIGLFMSRDLLAYCNIFRYSHFNDEFVFVYMTQSLDELEPLCGSGIPDLGYYINNRDLNWNAGPELMHIAELCRGAHSELSQPIKEKYMRTVELYRHRYPQLIENIERNRFDFTAVFPDADWDSVIKRHAESRADAIKTRVEF